MIKWMLITFIIVSQGAMAEVEQNKLLSKMKIVQGSGIFKQEKYFNFLTTPIVSKGVFKVDQQTALWQTQSPVFSEILFKSNGIYRRLAPETQFELILNSSDISHILGTIFSGEIQKSDWQISTNLDCIELVPNNEQLALIFNQISLCLVEDKQRIISLFDKQNNKTVIEMQVLNDALSTTDIADLELKQ